MIKFDERIVWAGPFNVEDILRIIDSKDQNGE